MLQQYNSGYLCDDGTFVMIDEKTGIEDKIQLNADEIEYLKSVFCRSILSGRQTSDVSILIENDRLKYATFPGSEW